MKSSPLSLVKERFGDKQKLVAAVQKLATDGLFLDRVNESKGLARVSNAKLLRLHDCLTAVKKDFGSRDKLIGEILQLENRIKDEGFKSRLERYPTPRLVDAHSAAAKRIARAKKKADAAPKKAATKKRVARSKKAKAKARAK